MQTQSKHDVKVGLLQKLIDSGAFFDHADWFVQRADRYPFFAQAPTAIKPPMVNGEHMSVRLKYGWRVWGFETEAARDQFIAQYSARLFPE
jgi:hypothetical protein